MSDATYQPKVYRKQGSDELVVADGGTITVESGGTIEIESGGALTIADGALEAPDIALAQGSVLVGDSDGEASALSAKGSGKILVGNGTTITSVSVSGDATLSSAGVLTIATGAVEDSMIEGLSDGEFIIGVDGTAANNAKVTMSGDATLANTGALTIAEGAVEDSMIEGLAAGQIIVGVDGTAANNTKVTLSGDVTMDATGAVTIAAGAVEASMLADGAGIAALVTAGGGASAAYAKTTSGAQTLLAANESGEGARTVLIVVTVTETFAAGDGAATIFDIGETDSTTKFKATLNTGTAGDVLTYAGSLTEEKALLVTATAATGSGAGGISITVLALPAA